MAASIAGKVIVLTGAAQGIGAVYARDLASEGARLVMSDIAAEPLQALADEIGSAGGDVHPVVADVSSESDTKRLAEESVERYGRIDGLINNAALFSALLPKRSFFDVDPDLWDKVMAVNVRGPFLCCRAILPQMQRQGSGSIVNIASSTVHAGTIGFVHYVTSKSALVGFTRVLAHEFGPDGIRVNVVTPGLIETEGVLERYPQEARNAAIASRSLARAQLPEDLTGTIKFLLSDDSGFTTGQTFNVDGGIVFH